MKAIVLLLMILSSTISLSQKMKMIEGNISNIEHINKYDLVLVYDNLKIPNYDSEEDFLKDKISDREEKEAGSGERFKESWFADRESKFYPKFIESFNKRFDNNEISISEKSNAKYIIKVHTQELYPGYNVGVRSHVAEITANISIYEKGKLENILFSVVYIDVPGTARYNSGDRIAECYAKLAKEFAKKIKKVYVYDASFQNVMSNEEIKNLHSDVVRKEELVETQKVTKADSSTNDSCDIIYKMDGSEIKSKVLEITDTTIKYKKQDQLDGPIRNVARKDVFLIIYKDGTREVFKNK
jgi:hypothetical protein